MGGFLRLADWFRHPATIAVLGRVLIGLPIEVPRCIDRGRSRQRGRLAQASPAGVRLGPGAVRRGADYSSNRSPRRSGSPTDGTSVRRVHSPPAFSTTCLQTVAAASGEAVRHRGGRSPMELSWRRLENTPRCGAVSKEPNDSGEDPVQRLRCAALHGLGHVRIEVQGDRDGCVPQHLARHLRVDAAAQHEGRSGVAQIMEADRRER